MPIETNLNRVPYYDDFDETNNFYRILFRPSTAVQARELTQMQSIQQDQIEKFGKHVFVDGSVVDGCDLAFDNKINYLKITDNYSNGTAISAIDLEGKYLLSSSNLYSYVVSSAEGSEGSPPDLKTLYIKYNNSGTYANGTQQNEYSADDEITVYTSSNVNFATITVANAAMSPSGNGYVVGVTDGVVFHKGVFIRAEEQKIIVSKYDANPNNVTVGFTTVETIVTPEIDTSLLDNAQGVRNSNAPGAHRLKMTPVLTVRTTDNTSSTNTTNFFSLVEFVDGKATRILTDPQYASLGNELARRTYEESGNYVVNPFVITTGIRYSDDVANTTHINAFVDKGIGYVQGYRVEYNDKVNIPVRKGNDVEYVESQTITGNFGNYVIVNELSGIFNVNSLERVQLYNAAQKSVTTGNLSAGSVAGGTLGHANIRAIVYHSGTPGTASCQYKVYLTNINMILSYNFRQVKSLYGSISGTAYADLVLESGIAVLKETNLSNLVLPLGKNAVRNLRNSSDAPNDYVTQYNFRSSNTFTFTKAQGSIGTLTVPTTGVGTSGQELPYSGGTLTSTSELDFIFIATNSANTANLSGTVSTSGNVVTGNGTNFNDSSSGLYLQSGDFIYVANSTAQELKIISTVTNATSLQVNTAFSGTFPDGASIIRHIPAGSVINMTKPTANITIIDTSSANVYVGAELNKDLDATAYYNLRRETAVGISKVINKNRFVKISMASNTTGPWNLGLSDIHKIRGVYIGNSTVSYGEYSTSNRNIADQFTLDNGQRDDRYDHGKLYAKNSSDYNSTMRLLVELDHFTHNRSNGVGFISVESYPIDDANTSNTSAITTQEIPLYTGANGIRLDLRDCIDFRPLKANTANSATTVNTATANPPTTTTFDVASGGAYSFTPDEEFTTDFSYYIGRIDKLYIDINGVAGVKEGVPSINSRTPEDKHDAMTLATAVIPPYPSLPFNVSISYNRPDYAINLSSQQIKRFTMKDIGVLEQRIKRLEYYTTLTLLESATSQLKILDGSGNDRFKNGFLVDSFNDASISDTDNEEYQNFSPGYDFNNSEIVPRQAINWVDLMPHPSNQVGEYTANTLNQSAATNRVHLLSYNTQELMKNPSASKKRSISQGTVFNFRGIITLDPPGSHKIDVTSNPSLDSTLSSLGNVKVVNHVLIGEAYNIESAINSVNQNSSQYIPPNTPAHIIPLIYNNFTTGTYIQNISVNAYLDPILIKFSCSALKPNTIFHPFFDGVRVSSFCQKTNSSFVPSGAFGGELKTDSSGNLYGRFYLPKGIFLIGERIFKVVDVSNLVTDSETIRSEASAVFFGSNIDISRASISVQSQPSAPVWGSTRPVVETPKPTAPSKPVTPVYTPPPTPPPQVVTVVPPPTPPPAVYVPPYVPPPAVYVPPPAPPPVQQYTPIIQSQPTPPTYTPPIVNPPYQEQVNYAYTGGTDSPTTVTLPNFTGSVETALAFLYLGHDITGWTEIPDGLVLPDGVSGEGGG